MNASTITETAGPALSPSFNYSGKTIGFVEAKGRDASFPRWRLCLYYEPNLAETVFFESADAYDAFLVEARKNSFADYSAYRAAFDNLNLCPA